MSEFITAVLTEPAYLIPTDKDDQPRLLAELFCALNSQQQAEFFDRIATIDREHWNRRGVFQWRHMQKDLSERARKIIVDMCEHTTD